MGSSGFSDSWGEEADTHLPLGTPMRPDTVTSVYRSSFDLFPGRPPAAPLVMRSTEEVEEAVYAARVLKSASMPYLYRPVTAMAKAPSVKALRGFEEHDNEVAETARLPNWVNISDAEHGAYDPAGSKHFDHKAIFEAKPRKGARRPRRFRIDADVLRLPGMIARMSSPMRSAATAGSRSVVRNHSTAVSKPASK